MSEQTLYVWPRRFGAMNADDAKRHRSLEAENAKLKRLLADRVLELDVLKEINSKKW